MVFEALQNKERERNSLVSKSFTFYYSILCFPFVISRLHSLLLLLCGNYRFVVLAFYYVLYSLIVWGYKLFNIILSCLLLRTFNTHIRVMMNALVWIIINLFYVLIFIVSHWDVCYRYCLRLVGEMRDYIY